VTGILLVDKPEGMSSAGAIRALKSRLGGSKVGHLGTLDPFASGLLPLCLGEATKIARYLLAEEKAYCGTIRLGTATDSLDRTGTTIETAAVPSLSTDLVQEVARRFTGAQRQVPPMYSALKRDGVPLYKLARRGIEVEREARSIVIARLTLELTGPDTLEFDVECSKGTYIRVLGADIGRALGTVAHLERLRRTRVGNFRIDAARTPAALEALPTGAPLPLVPVRDALADLRALPLDEAGMARLRHGQQAALDLLPAPRGAGEVALVLDPIGVVAAIVEGPEAAAGWRLVRLLAAH
jgi:tRNA pseudouridine55 synthase